MSAPRIDDESHFLSETAARRDELRGNADAAAERLKARHAIGTAIGTTREDILDRIESLGFTGDSVRVLDVLPLVHVAWADGKVQKEERKAVLAVLEARGIAPRSDGMLLVEALLERRPSETFLAESLALVKDLAAMSGQESSDVVDLCARVAEASGGLLGLGGKTSAQERTLIESIARALGDSALERFKARFSG